MAYAPGGLHAEQSQSQSVKYRRPAKLDVRLYCHSFPFMYCRASSIGRDGLFVDCDLHDLPKHAYLEVEFELTENNSPKRYRLPVYVDSTSIRGANLLFSFPEEIGLGINDAWGH